MGINEQIGSYFGGDVLASDAATKRLQKAASTFAFTLSGGGFSDLLPTLARFCDQPPFTYWRRDLVCEVIEFIVQRESRLPKALQRASLPLDSAILNLFERAWSSDESRHDTQKAPDVERLLSISMPRHLRIAEHIFGNFLRFLWGLESDKSFPGIKNALAKLQKLIAGNLGSGFDDVVRNGIAHGEVSLQNDGINFGRSPNEVGFTAVEFDAQMDDLWAATISICIGILVSLSAALARKSTILSDLPARLLASLLSALRSYAYFDIHGSAQVRTGRGRELLLFVTAPRSGFRVLTFECLKVALAVHLLNPNRYDFVQFSIDAGMGVPQLGVIDIAKIATAFQNNRPPSTLENVFPIALFWGALGERMERWQMRYRFFRHYYQQARRNMRGPSKIYIRSCENVSVGWRGRIKITATVSKEFGKLSDPEILQEIHKLTRGLKNKLVWAPPTRFERKLPIPVFPSYIWVSLYAEDRSLRSIGKDGWLGDNLIATSEFKRFPWLKTIDHYHPASAQVGRTRMVIGRPAMFARSL